jgi:hypothetical protein
MGALRKGIPRSFCDFQELIWRIRERTTGNPHRHVFHKVITSHGLVETTSRLLGDAITDQMAIGVVDVLEVIEVDHQHSGRRPETQASLKVCILPEHSNVVAVNLFHENRMINVSENSNACYAQ